ncbi:MAG: hypothetical protein AB7F75_12165 [Planctomycetota bacterium]
MNMEMVLGALLVFGCMLWLGCFIDAVRRQAGDFKTKLVDEQGANKFLWISIVAVMPLGVVLYCALIPRHRVDKPLSGFHVASLGAAFVPFVGWIFSLVFFLTGLMQSRGHRNASGSAIGAIGVGMAIVLAIGSVSIHRSLLTALEGRPCSAPWAETHLFQIVVESLSLPPATH